MLTSFERGILTLVRNAVNGEKRPLPKDFDYKQAYEFGKKHQIIPLLYYGGAHIEDFVNSSVGTTFLMTTMKLASFSENQLKEIALLQDSFEKNGIEYMKLKGANLKALYPLGEMRLMSDADILIREKQMPQIKDALIELGYEYKAHSDYEWIWQKPELALELHKGLVPVYQKDLYAYFGDGWERAVRVEGKSEYAMSKEDEFVHLFAHLVKHYRDAGVGIKHFVDIYAYLNSNKDVNMEYVELTLKKLKLYDFFVNVKNTVNAWFCDTELDEISEFITQKVFESGVYGQKLASLTAAKLREKKQGKKRTGLGKFFVHIFPTFITMRSLFPVLDKAPILLPFMWVWRWLCIIFKEKEKVKRYKENSKIEITDQSISEYQCELNYVGLDYNF